jgi:hypothetical protein
MANELHVQNVKLKTRLMNSGHYIARRMTCSAILLEEAVLALVIRQLGIESNIFYKSVHLVNKKQRDTKPLNLSSILPHKRASFNWNTL